MKNFFLPKFTTFRHFTFRSMRGCIDAIATLQEWLILNRNKERYMAFLDIKAAYDSVDRKILWKKLEKKIPCDLFERSI